ncbi:MAG: hypothetical protein LUE17_09015 [Planctomycetaceae bacterium]|nr:hypothetical protein [Planctomycetaceae bacterium]
MPILLVYLLAIAALLSPCRAGEHVTIERGTLQDEQPDRTRLARTLYRHSFENIRDPDTGVLLPESAALNADGWPDFWEPVRAVGFPEYLIPGVRIEEDPSGMIPGAYRDLPNHALRMEFDGTRLGIRTRTPVPIDPQLAYEYSIRIRDVGLQGARIRTGIDWMRIDPAVVEVLRSDEIPDLLPGQVDWAVLPNTMVVNDPPPDANAARLFVVVDRDPTSIGGAYHGTVWVNDVVLKPLPKIHIAAPRFESSDPMNANIPVHYAGLFDNIPDPNNPGFFRGKRYSRQVEITDVYGQIVNRESNLRQPLEADDAGTAVEIVPFPRDAYGVYYFNIRLYDADQTFATDVMRAVAVMRPERIRDGLALHSFKPVFGVGAGIVPETVLASNGQLRRFLERSGAKVTKIIPWRASYAAPGENDDYYASLVREIRQLRSAGIGITGVIQPPSAMFGSAEIVDAVVDHPVVFSRIVNEAARNLGLYVDSWQWGGDWDPGAGRLPSGPNMEAAHEALRDFAGGMPTANNVVLDGGDVIPPTPRPDIVQGFVPAREPAERLWPLAAPLFPWLFDPYFIERGLIYPPARLSRLAPPPAMDQMEEQARLQLQAGSWLALEPESADAHAPSAPAERRQLEEMVVRAIYGTVLKPDAIFLGDLFHPSRGMLRRDVTSSGTLETMARPTFLAAQTLSELLEGAEYLGQLYLLPPFEAHVFRRPNADQSVIAIWHHDVRDVVPLAREELAKGPLLEQIDWAGNRAVVRGNSVPVRRVPSFVTGLSASLMLTRMSIRINPELPMMATTRRQNQTIEIVNHMTRQVPVTMRLRYAARLPDGAMENAWMVAPEELRVNLPPFDMQLNPGRMRYAASPDTNSQIQKSGPAGVDKSGLKIAQARVSVNSAPPADIVAYLPFRLRSDLDMDVEVLTRVDDPHFITLQLKLRWFPTDRGRRNGEIRLTPYYMKRGQMKEALAFPVTLKPSPVDQRGNPDAPFESVEMRIPRRPFVQTWVGLDEAGGSNFYLNDVTDFMGVE